jgi:hypothetical protein
MSIRQAYKAEVYRRYDKMDKTTGVKQVMAYIWLGCALLCGLTLKA